MPPPNPPQSTCGVGRKRVAPLLFTAAVKERELRRCQLVATDEYVPVQRGCAEEELLAGVEHLAALVHDPRHAAAGDLAVEDRSDPYDAELVSVACHCAVEREDRIAHDPYDTCGHSGAERVCRSC